MTNTDIVDVIDALVDEQMAGGEPRRGYAYGDPTYPRCGHCNRHWHGLPITQRIAAMYARGRFDEKYLTVDDTSAVLCQGSDFIGPMPAEESATPVSPFSISRSSTYGFLGLDDMDSVEEIAETLQVWMRDNPDEFQELIADLQGSLDFLVDFVGNVVGAFSGFAGPSEQSFVDSIGEMVNGLMQSISGVDPTAEDFDMVAFLRSIESHVSTIDAAITTEPLLDQAVSTGPTPYDIEVHP